jgi:hypothetical protein
MLTDAKRERDLHKSLEFLPREREKAFPFFIEFGLDLSDLDEGQIVWFTISG